MDLKITKKFIFLLLQKTFYSQKDKCFDTLLKLITDDFNFNTFEKKKGLGVLCNRMTSLKKAIPNMKLSLNHFNDSVNNSAVVILMVMGIMKKPWLNNKLLPATNSYERIGLVFHIIPNKDNTKIKEVYLKSENIYQECYEKIKALDLLHTAFKLNRKKKVNKVQVNKVQVNKVQVNKVQVNKVQVNKVIKEKEIEEKEIKKKEVEEKEVDNNIIGINKNNSNKLKNNTSKYNKNNKKEIKVEENQKNNEKNYLNREIKEIKKFQENQTIEENVESESDDNDEGESESDENDNDESDESNKKKQEVLKKLRNLSIYPGNNNFKKINSITHSNFPSSKEDKTLTTGNLNNLGLNHLIKGGYSKINIKIPNKKSYKQLYDISGKEYNSLIQQLQKGGSNNISLYKSNTYSNMKDQVICSITGQILDNNKKLLSNIFGLPTNNKLINEHSKSMSDGTKTIVRKIVNESVKTFKSLVPKLEIKDEIKGGNYEGYLGTELFKGGSNIDKIVPWLLTLGAILLKGIDHEIYKKTSSRGKKSVNPLKKSLTKKVSKKGLTKKVSKKGLTKKVSKKSLTKKVSKKGLTKKVSKKGLTKSKKKDKTIKKSKKWKAITNNDIKKLMKGGMCGDPNLNNLSGCRKPEWNINCI
jgi:hypothetical protein